MRIGFDVSQTGPLKAGCGYFADSLIRNLAEVDSENTYTLYPTFGDAYWDPDWSATTCLIDRPNFRRGLGQETFEATQLFWNNPPTDFEDQLGAPAIVHANNFFCPTKLRNARLVYTLYDLAFVEYPEWTTEANRVVCFTGVFTASLYADCIVAISDYTRRYFLEIFPHYPADRVVVVHLASRFSGRSNRAKPASLPTLRPEHFWLMVGTLEPRKNHRRLLQAYAHLRAQGLQTFPLVLAGGKGWLMNDLEKTLDELGLRQDVTLLGYVEDEVLQWLYENCFAFIYPALFEGFGLPVLEAMSLGAPVITSNSTSLPEIVGDAGLLIDPLDEEDICRAMLSLVKGEIDRSALQVLAQQRSQRFSWKQTALQVKEIYRQLASQSAIDREKKQSLPPSLHKVYSNWDRFGKEDPLWAVLTDPSKKGGKWKPEEFFAVGQADIRRLLEYLRVRGITLSFNKALDFGCGAGRLTQALAEYFTEVHGVDIAPSMIETAKKLSKYPEKCFFYVNLADDLSLFEDNTFDLVVTFIVLQHIPRPHALQYIKEFVRVVKPGGIIVFQVPDSRKDVAALDSSGAATELSANGQEPVMLMSGLPRTVVEQALAEAGATLLDVLEDQCVGPEWLSYRYCATKVPTAS